MNKKEASSKQEKMVADYMGWKVVAGSGSRPFLPGDIGSDNFLVECKTHIDRQENIIFYKKHWMKISLEARSINKYPVLIVDNGTQKSEYTWVMFQKSAIIPEISNKILNLINSSSSGNTITFKHNAAISLYKSAYDIDLINFFEVNFDNDILVIMPLEEYNKYYREHFEC